jgi:uncharacterized membrane protein
MGDVEGQYFECDGVAVESELFIFREYIIVDGDAQGVAGVVDGEVRDADDHDLWGKGGGFLPGGAFALAGQGFFALEGAVGHDGIVVGRGDMEVQCGFIGRMVYAGEPVVGAVGPVVAEEAPATELVVRDDETICGNTLVADGIAMLAKGGAAGMEKEPFGFLCKADVFFTFFDRRYVHAFSCGVWGSEVEGEFRGVGVEAEGDHGAAADIVVAVVHFQGKIVMKDIDGRVIGLSGQPGAEQGEEDTEQERFVAHGLEFALNIPICAIFIAQLSALVSEYLNCPSWVHRLPSIYKLLVSFAVATIISVCLMPVRMENMTRVMIGWDCFSVCMIIISGVIFSTMRPRQIRVLAKQEDAGRIVVFFIVLVAILGSLMGVLLLLQNKGIWLLGKGLETMVYLTGVACSWVLLHIMFAYRYALLYYGDHPLDPDTHTVGLQIPNELWPDYLDFCYFSFVIGMTFQVSDIEISSRQIRRVALVHGMLSFLFNTVIVALTINVVVDLKT